ncbi:hypothetical protein [Sediminibacillus massiliensis]|uniref:hypothetical protein n=1 Tax=Sediminibacillus massiliensis TaxID=1926277 RepID=UPI0009886EE6|nr:hypothetical protein [Sediminibacillus massiliensis]
MKKNLFIVMVISLMVVLTACGGNNSDESSQEGGQDQTEQSESTDDQNADSGGDSGENTLNISATNFQFDQEEYTVEAGEEVTINLTSEEGQHGLAIDEYDVNIEGEGSATFTPEEPGEYEIYCSVPCGQGHSGMVSTLVVQ